jgi:hypothetical protein
MKSTIHTTIFAGISLSTVSAPSNPFIRNPSWEMNLAIVRCAEGTIYREKLKNEYWPKERAMKEGAGWIVGQEGLVIRRGRVTRMIDRLCAIKSLHQKPVLGDEPCDSEMCRGNNISL